MSKDSHNQSRRRFLKNLGIGSASMIGLMAVEPFKAVAFGQDEKTLPDGASVNNKMTYRVNRHTNDKLSLLGYGMMRLPQKDGHIDQKEVESEVDYAIAHGINYFDTAPVYHGGKSEEAVGKALSRYPRNSYFVATKMSNFDSKDWPLEKAKEIYHNSFKKLQVDYIDYYLLHSVGGKGMEEFSPRFEDNGLLDFLLEEREAGRIRNLGFSYHGNVEVFDYLVDNNDEYNWDFVQIQMNYIDWRHAGRGNTDAEYLYNKLEKAGIQAIIMEPLRGGRLANVPDDSKAQLNALRPNDTPARWAFRWVGSHQNVLTTLSGMTTMNVLKENVETFSPIDMCSEKEYELLAKVADTMSGVPVIPCTDCKYCMPCPFGLDIPGNFALYNKAVNDKILPLPDKGSADYQARIDKVSAMFKEGLNKKQWATKCTDCEACIPKCPQQIRIPSRMTRIVEILQKR
jgi:predicted aldo/keto reductase-like oxidoreductase